MCKHVVVQMCTYVTEGKGISGHATFKETEMLCTKVHWQKSKMTCLCTWKLAVRNSSKIISNVYKSVQGLKLITKLAEQHIFNEDVGNA